MSLLHKLIGVKMQIRGGLEAKAVRPYCSNKKNTRRLTDGKVYRIAFWLVIG